MKTKKSKRVGRERPWLGGYARREANGELTFIIEKRVLVDGVSRRFHISTRCTDEEAALEHLARFQANPLAYSPGGVEPQAPLIITNELILEHEQWQLDVKKNSKKHARSATRLLADWMDALGTSDLRKVPLADLHAALATWETSRQHRIIAIKNFYGWLRKVKSLVRHAEDPTLDLPVPQASPEKHERRKAVAWETVRDCFEFLPEHYRDVLQLAVATGWHVSELGRFITDERSRIEKPGIATTTRNGLPVLAVLVVWHKTKKWTRTAIVHERHLEAAQRLKAGGKFIGETRMRLALRDALAKADEKRREKDPSWQDRAPFTLGVMRHSVATWSLELGDRIEDTAAALDHADRRTTERFYADLVVPKVAMTTRVLERRPEGESLN